MAKNDQVSMVAQSAKPVQKQNGQQPPAQTGESGLRAFLTYLGQATGLFKPAALANQVLRGDAFARSAVGDMAGASTEFTQEFQKDEALAKLELDAEKAALQGDVRQLTSERDAARAQLTAGKPRRT